MHNNGYKIPVKHDLNLKTYIRNKDLHKLKIIDKEFLIKQQFLKFLKLDKKHQFSFTALLYIFL
jgi:hypothetical protein